MWSKKLSLYKEELPYQRPAVGSGAAARKITTHNGFKAYLGFSPDVGAVVRYKNHVNWKLDIDNCHVVVKINDDFNTAQFSWFTGMPEVHHIVALSNAKYNKEHFYDRKVDILEYVEVTPTELEGVINADVQDYIARALARFKQTATPST